jgi:hypothetical protein
MVPRSLAAMSKSRAQSSPVDFEPRACASNCWCRAFAEADVGDLMRSSTRDAAQTVIRSRSHPLVRCRCEDHVNTDPPVDRNPERRINLRRDAIRASKSLLHG